MAEVLTVIDRLTYTGSLQINFLKGKARDMKWASSREVSPPEV
jgi:hypothetical protein